MGLYRQFRSLVFSPEKSSIKDEFVQLVQERERQLDVPAERVLAGVRPDAAEDAAVDVACFPGSPCLDENELYEAAVTQGSELAPERQSHLRECEVCQYAVSLAVPNEERTASMVQRLAAPPGDLERNERITERILRREAQVRSLRGGIDARERDGIRVDPPVERSDSVPVRERRSESGAANANAAAGVSSRNDGRSWLSQLAARFLSPEAATAYGMVLVVVLCYPKFFMDSRNLKDEVQDLRVNSQALQKESQALQKEAGILRADSKSMRDSVNALPIELEGFIAPVARKSPNSKTQYVLKVKGDKENRVVYLNPGSKSAGFAPVRHGGPREGRVKGFIRVNKSGQAHVTVEDVQFGKSGK